MAYKKGGIVFPRVTDIIADSTNKSAGLVQWSANCAIEWIKENIKSEFNDICDEFYSTTPSQLNEARFAYKAVSKQALGVGSEVHNAIEKWLQKKKYKLTSRQAVTAFNAFLEWQADVDLKPTKLEHTVWGDRWAGTLDMVCNINGKVYVVDFKTSKKIYLSEMGVQLAAYRSCVPEAVGNGILRLDKLTGKFEWKDFSKRYESDLAVWEAMLVLYFAKHPRIRARWDKEKKHG